MTCGLGVVLRLDVADAQHVRRIDVGLGIPRLHLFKIRNGFVGAASAVVREAQQLDRFLVIRIFGGRLFEILSCLEDVSLCVVDHAKGV